MTKPNPAINGLIIGKYKTLVRKKTCVTLRRKFYSLFDFKQRHNTTAGKKEKILDAVLHASVTNDFIENSTNTLRLTKKDVPAPRTVRYHLEKLKIEEVVEQFNRILEEIYKEAKKRGFFRKKVDIAVDITDWLFYGDSNTEMIVGTQPKRGTHWAYKFITLSVVEKGIRFTLKALPIRNYSEINRLLGELIVFAKEKVNINRAYLDRWFYEVEVINLLKRQGVHFIIQAQQIKSVIEENKDKEVIVKDYKMKRKKIPYSTADVKLFIVPHRIKKDGRAYFVTDLDTTEENAKVYAEAFRKRWGIETSYRVKKDFRPKTTSTNSAIRLFFFLFSVCFYNLWVLASIFIGIALKIVVEKPLITAKMFGNMIIAAYKQPG